MVKTESCLHVIIYTQQALQLLSFFVMLHILVVLISIQGVPGFGVKIRIKELIRVGRYHYVVRSTIAASISAF